MNIYRVSPWKAFLAIAIALTLACDGCTSVQLVADYNKKIDNGVTELQKKTDTFLARVGRYFAGFCLRFARARRSVFLRRLARFLALSLPLLFPISLNLRPLVAP